MLKMDLRAHAHSFYTEASQLMQAVKNVGGIPQVIVNSLCSAISLAEKVHNAGEQTPDQIAKELKQIKLILIDHDKRQTSGIQVVQAAMSG
jgi:prophage DNA circulation protein